ncbi:unnamed protein product [Gongylonema pulchrum]|uniref:Secreted protein n=1 Tax=Gongylonema pulchrum TaxID=637853 RepID=A0A183E991_9BILA|nr:unnamed protein product [Gongylonema pulchrum]
MFGGVGGRRKQRYVMDGLIGMVAVRPQTLIVFVLCGVISITVAQQQQRYIPTESSSGSGNNNNNNDRVDASDSDDNLYILIDEISVYTCRGSMVSSPLLLYDYRIFQSIFA